MDRAPGTGTTGGRGDAPVLASSTAAARRGAAVALLTVVAVVAGALAGPWRPVLRSVDRPPRTPPPTPPPTPEPPPSPDPLTEALRAMDIEPWDLTGLMLVMVAMLALGLLYVLARWLRSRPPRHVEVAGDPGDVAPGDAVAGAVDALPDLPALREGVDGADAHLRGRLEPADAVIAAWVALEDGAARSGVVRDPASTPTEFTVAVLGRAPVDPEATRTLLGLYLRARFGEDPMTPDDVAAAAVAVWTLAAGLADRGPDAPAPDAPAPDAPGPDEDAA